MTKEKSRQFLERLIAAGEEGLENISLDDEENDFARELIHDGDACIRQPAANQQFLVAEYGAHEALYIARGWAKHTREGLLVTEQGRGKLKLVPRPAAEAY